MNDTTVKEQTSAHEQMRYYNQMRKKHTKSCLTNYVIVLSFACALATAAYGASYKMQFGILATTALITAIIAMYMFCILLVHLGQIDAMPSDSQKFALWTLWLRPRGKLKERIDEATRGHAMHLYPSYTDANPYAFCNPYVNKVVYEHRLRQCRKYLLVCWLITLACIYFLAGLGVFAFFTFGTIGVLVYGFKESNPT